MEGLCIVLCYVAVFAMLFWRARKIKAERAMYIAELAEKGLDLVIIGHGVIAIEYVKLREATDDK